MDYFCYSRAVYVPAHPLLFFSQEILSLCLPEAVYQISISYYVCNWSKSLWCGVVVWCGGVVVWWLRPTLVFSLAQAEQPF